MSFSLRQLFTLEKSSSIGDTRDQENKGGENVSKCSELGQQLCLYNYSTVIHWYNAVWIASTKRHQMGQKLLLNSITEHILIHTVSGTVYTYETIHSHHSNDRHTPSS